MNSDWVVISSVVLKGHCTACFCLSNCNIRKEQHGAQKIPKGIWTNLYEWMAQGGPASLWGFTGTVVRYWLRISGVVLRPAYWPENMELDSKKELCNPLLFNAKHYDARRWEVLYQEPSVREHRGSLLSFSKSFFFFLPIHAFIILVCLSL